MGDFFQNGIITTLHRLGHRPIEELEAELRTFQPKNPMALVLPSLFSELEGPALGPIIEELAQLDYLDEIIIGLDRADESQFQYAREYFSRLPQRHRILWNDGPRLQALDKLLQNEDLAPSEPGKGRNAWFCFGYFLASGRANTIALHDCDILTYNRELPARLLYPIANPAFSYKFCKGYYYRASEDKINGRVSRLLVTPLVRALKKMFGQDEYLDYLDSFRYPLAGEFSMGRDVVKIIRIPSDWGLEIGVLSEVQRNYALSRICQVDIADAYDHKHQDLSAHDDSKGLSRMSIDISKAIFRKMATNGAIFSQETFRTLKATYYRIALDFVHQFHSDAMINGLKLDRHSEERAVELFAENLISAGQFFLENPKETPFIPSWERVTSAIPDFLDQLYTAVERDNEERPS
ncbi:MAG: glycosyl transferase [bacterium]|nr:glycosyl transferase [bacterium]